MSNVISRWHALIMWWNVADQAAVRPDRKARGLYNSNIRPSANSLRGNVRLALKAMAEFRARARRFQQWLINAFENLDLEEKVNEENGDGGEDGLREAALENLKNFIYSETLEHEREKVPVAAQHLVTLIY